MTANSKVENKAGHHYIWSNSSSRHDDQVACVNTLLTTGNMNSGYKSRTLFYKLNCS